MSTILISAALCLAGFALGGIPTSHLIASKRHIDLSRSGSGNLGATNLSRSLGWRLGLLVGVLDLLKGVLPSLVGLVFFTLPSTALLAVGMLTILGHIYTPYLTTHKGGKGVATGAGVIAVLFPSAIFFGLAVFFSVALITRYISVSSMTTYLLLIPFYIIRTLMTGGVLAYDKLAFLGILSLLIIVAHRTNIRRLMHHTEPKFSFSAEKESV